MLFYIEAQIIRSMSDKKNKKCILLVRVSTESQSFEAQEKELFDLAIKDGYSKEQITPIAIKESAIKLKEEERLGLQKMYEYLATGEYDCVYAWEVSRIARTKKVLFSVQDKLVKNKIQLIIKNPSVRLLKDNGEIDEAAELVFTLFAQLSESEMRNKKDRFSRGKRQKASEGKYAGANIPFGYKVDYDNDKKIVVDEERAEIVKATYNLYEEGISQTKIPIELEKRGHPRISIPLVSHILKNESYTGKESEEKRMKGAGGRGDWTKYPRKYPPIISKEQFERCRTIARENNSKLNSKTSNIYYAANLIYCPTCGSNWTGCAHDTSYQCYISHLPKRVYEYGCYGKLGEQCQNKTRMSINILDSLLWEVALSEEFEVRLEDNESEIAVIDSEIEEKNKSLVQYDKLFSDNNKKREKAGMLYLDEVISKSVFDQKLKELDKIKSEYEQDVVSIKSVIGQLELKRERLEKKRVHSSIDDRVKAVLNDEEIAIMSGILNNVNSIKEEIRELRESANDVVRYDLIHEHIQKVYVEPISFRYKHKTKRLGDKRVEGKLIRIYTYQQGVKWLKNEEPAQYPYYFVSVSNDGIGGKTIYHYMRTNNEFKDFPKDDIDLYNGDFFKYNFEKIERFVNERKREMRRKEKEERLKLHSSIEFIKQKEETKRLKEEERKRKAREYAKRKYWENKKGTS